MASVAVLLILVLFGYLGWVGVGVSIACEDAQCELTRRSLLHGTSTDSFRLDDVVAVHANIDIVESGSRIYSSEDPEIELTNGERIKWYPKRVDPNFVLVKPEQLRRHLGGMAEPPNGGDFVLSTDFVFIGFCLAAVAALVAGVAWRRIQVLVDGVAEQVVVHNGGVTSTVAFADVANVLHSRSKNGHEAIVLRRFDQSEVAIPLSSAQAQAVRGELNYHGFVVEGDTQPRADGPNTFKHAGLVFLAINLLVVAYVVWLVP